VEYPFEIGSSPMALKRFLIGLALGLGIASACFGGEDFQPTPIGPFGGINNRDSSYTIGANQAQDALNVDLTPGGKSVKKRHGYGQAWAATITTSAVHGTYIFFNSSGNDVVLFFNDVYGFSSVSGGALTTLFTNGASGATWQCTDAIGKAYCVNSSRTKLINTDGTTVTTMSGFTSTGTMVAATPGRLAMAGFSDAPSRIDFSTDGDFTTWGTGAVGSSPVQITVNSPGAKITHIVYAFNRLMWFKDTSFGYILIGNQPSQTDWVVKTVAYDVGTNDNSSVYREGILYFRGKDSHIYAFDGSNYYRQDREITGTINQTQTKASNSWTQNTTANFNTGLIDVDIDSTTLTNTLKAKTTFWSYTNWTGASLTDTYNFADTTGSPGNIQSTFPDNFAAFRDGTGGTKNVWTKVVAANGSVSVSGNALTISDKSGGSSIAYVNNPMCNATAGTTFYAHINSVVGCGSGNLEDFALILNTANTSTPASGTYWRVGFGVNSSNQLTSPTNNNANSTGDTVSFSMSAQSTPVDIYFWLNSSQWQVKVGAQTFTGTHTWAKNNARLYLVNGASTGVSCRSSGNTYSETYGTVGVATQTFSLTSTTLDTGISTPTWSTFHDSLTGNGSDTYTTQVSADNSSFDAGVAVTSGSVITSAAKRYIKVNTTMTQDTASGKVLALSYFDLNAGSSGTYRSAVHNAPNWNSWDSFAATFQNNGGSNSFFIRGQAGTFNAGDTTPSWVAISNGQVPTLASGIYFQIRDDIVSASSSQTPQLSAFTQNWFEGTAADKAYATYFEDKILWSITFGSGQTTNNRILVYDMLSQAWLLYDWPVNGFYVRANKLYFGSSNGGYVYKYGDIEDDNGAAINAYWKSKDFFIGTPFTMGELSNISVAYKSVSNSTMTVTYVTNGQTSNSYSIAEYNANGGFAFNNRNLSPGLVNQYNVQVGNNAADQPFEVFGIQVGLRPKSWIPTIP